MGCRQLSATTRMRSHQQAVGGCLSSIRNRLMAALASWAVFTTFVQAEPPRHYLMSADLPPGTVAQGQLIRSPDMAGYFQPVQLRAPQGARISLAIDGVFSQPQIHSVTAGMQVGEVYRFQVSNIPLNEGLEVYPSVEIINRLHPPEEEAQRFPVTVEMTLDDLEMALAGQLITRVIYLEPPDSALTAVEDRQQQRYFDIGARNDPLQVADRLGRPMAILRMGGILPDNNGPSDRFLFGSPPVLLYELGISKLSHQKTISSLAPMMSRAAVKSVVSTESLVPIVNEHDHSLDFQINDQSSTYCQKVDSAVIAASWEVGDEKTIVPISQQHECNTSPATCLCQPTLPNLVTITVPPNSSKKSSHKRPRPWPDDEYICDGGDDSQQVRVQADWTVDGLDVEDTIAHFDTLDGRTIVEASDRVCIYAPRFAAVRRISGLRQHVQQEQMIEMNVLLQARTDEDLEIASTTLQQVQPNVQLGRQPANIFLDRQILESVGQRQELGTLADGFLPHENNSLIRYGVYDETEKLLTTKFLDAAEAWSHDAAVQIVIEDVHLQAEALYQQAQTLYKVDPFLGKPRLCLAKTASHKTALPGEFVDFTLRFDNVGNERIGNVTLMDNLSPRLEYVEGSAQCNLEAEFFTLQSDDDSLILRWEITEPMEPGTGGLIRFRCRVR